MNTIKKTLNIEEFHWHLGLLQTLDVGLIVLDRDYRIQLWNSFMENHSGSRPAEVLQRNLFLSFPDLPAKWFKRKVDSVFLLNNRAFITWEERPYLFNFKTYRPITGESPFMYQNVTIIPLTSPSGNVDQVGVLIYDVTDAAVGRTALEQANEQLQLLSRTDRLTELYNRGYWEEQLRAEFKRYHRTQAASSIIMLDIDHFKAINDTYGHQAGDEVIRQVSRTIREHVRSTDICGRYGGEEFGLLLIDTPAVNAQILAERLRLAMQAQVVKHNGREITFTISIGISEVSNGQEYPEQWIEEADQALYYSKENGRNLTTVAGQ